MLVFNSSQHDVDLDSGRTLPPDPKVRVEITDPSEREQDMLHAGLLQQANPDEDDQPAPAPVPDDARDTLAPQTAPKDDPEPESDGDADAARDALPWVTGQPVDDGDHATVTPPANASPIGVPVAQQAPSAPTADPAPAPAAPSENPALASDRPQES